jgi:hypothetical protein
MELSLTPSVKLAIALLMWIDCVAIQWRASVKTCWRFVTLSQLMAGMRVMAHRQGDTS